MSVLHVPQKQITSDKNQVFEGLFNMMGKMTERIIQMESVI